MIHIYPLRYNHESLKVKGGKPAQSQIKTIKVNTKQKQQQQQQMNNGA